MTAEFRTVQFPANELVVPVRGDTMFALRQSDWARLRQRVLLLRRSMAWLTNAAWALLGVSVSAVLAFVAWLPAETQFGDDARLRFAFVSPLLAVLSIACLLVGVVFLVVDHRTLELSAVNVDDVVAEMDTLHLPSDVSGVETLLADLAATMEPIVASGDSPPSDQSSSVGSLDSVDWAAADLPDPDAATRWSQWKPGPRSHEGGLRDNGNINDVIRPGDRIRHRGFGDGTVTAISAAGSRTVATVVFDSVGRKRLLLKIAPISWLGDTDPIPSQ